MQFLVHCTKTWTNPLKRLPQNIHQSILEDSRSWEMSWIHWSPFVLDHSISQHERWWKHPMDMNGPGNSPGSYLARHNFVTEHQCGGTFRISQVVSCYVAQILCFWILGEFGVWAGMSGSGSYSLHDGCMVTSICYKIPHFIKVSASSLLPQYGLQWSIL